MRRSTLHQLGCATICWEHVRELGLALLHELGHLEKFGARLILLWLLIHCQVTFHRLHERIGGLDLLNQVLLFYFVIFGALSRHWTLIAFFGLFWRFICQLHCGVLLLILSRFRSGLRSRRFLIFSLLCFLFGRFWILRWRTTLCHCGAWQGLSLRILHIHLLHQFHLFEKLFGSHLSSQNIFHLRLHILLWLGCAALLNWLFLTLLSLFAPIFSWFCHFVLFSLEDFLASLNQIFSCELLFLVGFFPHCFFLVNSLLSFSNFCTQFARMSLRGRFTATMQRRWPHTLFPFGSLNTLLLLFDDFAHDLFRFGLFQFTSFSHLLNTFHEFSTIQS